MNWYIRSEDGADYRVGRWIDGVWHPGTRADAVREARLLRRAGEPKAYAWGRSW